VLEKELMIAITASATSLAGLTAVVIGQIAQIGLQKKIVDYSKLFFQAHLPWEYLPLLVRLTGFLIPKQAKL
jgi:hypothetical protein